MQTRLILSGLLFLAPLASHADPLVQVDPASVDLSKDAGPLPNPDQRMKTFRTRSPLAGEPAPVLTGYDLKKKKVTIGFQSRLKPILLVAGSVSCFIYRPVSMEQLDRFKKSYGNKVDVVMLYVLEAHPVDGKSPYSPGQWVGQQNKSDRVLVKQPQDLSARIDLAAAMTERYSLDGNQILVDDMNNDLWQTLGRFPNFTYVISAKGTVLFKEPWNTRDADANGRPVFLSFLEKEVGMPLGDFK